MTDTDSDLAQRILQDEGVLQDIGGFYKGKWEITKICRVDTPITFDPNADTLSEIIICTEGDDPVMPSRPDNWTDEEWEEWMSLHSNRTQIFLFEDFEEDLVHCGSLEDLSPEAQVLWSKEEADFHYQSC